MTTATPSPYNTARSMKASPRTSANAPAIPATALPGLKHVASKSGGDAPHASPASSARQLPRPSSTGGASIGSARSHVSQLSSRIKVSPYAIPLSSRSNSDKPKVTPRPEPPMSSRSNARGEESAPPNTHLNAPHRPPSPIDVSRGSDSPGPGHARLSEPSIDLLLLREGLDPSVVASPEEVSGVDQAGVRTAGGENTHLEQSPHKIPDPAATSLNSSATPTDDACVVCVPDVNELSDSVEKDLDQVPFPVDTSLTSPGPSPIPVVNNLNLSQYSCAFADTIRGYCSDISSDCSRREDIVQPESLQQAGDIEARYSVDVQVTSRLHERAQESPQCRKVQTKLWKKILCCGCMQQK